MPIIDEKREILNIIRNKTIDTTPMKTCYKLAKYYYSIGKTREQVETELHSFLKENYTKYNYVKFEDKISSITTSLKNRNNSMIYVDKIVFYKEEMDLIDKLPRPTLKRMAFVILYLTKLNIEKYGKTDVWLTDDVGRLSKLAKVTGKTIEKDMMLALLQDFGYIKRSKSIKQFLYHVLFNKTIGMVAFEITELKDESEIILHYKKYVGEKVSNCDNCGILYSPTSNKNKYCSTCAREIQQEQKNKWKRENWNKEEK